MGTRSHGGISSDAPLGTGGRDSLPSRGLPETAEILTGYNSSTTGGDNRPITNTNTYSQVNFYEYPLLAHYYGFWSHGWKRRIFFTGGVELRHVGKIRTGNDFTYPSGATDYNENPATPNKVNDLGVVARTGHAICRRIPHPDRAGNAVYPLAGADPPRPGLASVVNQLEAGAEPVLLVSLRLRRQCPAPPLRIMSGSVTTSRGARTSFTRWIAI